MARHFIPFSEIAVHPISYFATLLEILRKNRRKLNVDPVTRAVQEPIDREFTASTAKLTPLKARIAATDRLIDQIVYKLYELTDEEIALVEGTSS